MTFQIGDAVEIIGGNGFCVHIGKHTTVIGISTNPGHLCVDLPPSPGNGSGGYAAFRPKHLRHIPYDGNQASTWDSMKLIWQPQELVTL